MPERWSGTLIRNCPRCALRAVVSVTQQLVGAQLSWSSSLRCESCGFEKEQSRQGPAPHEVRAALLRVHRFVVRLEPTKMPRHFTIRRIASRLDLGETEATHRTDAFFGEGVQATGAEAEHFRSTLDGAFHATVTEIEPLPARIVGEDELKGLESMWTTERDRHVLQGPAGWVPVDVIYGRLWVIDDDELAVEVVARMAEAGVARVDMETGWSSDDRFEVVSKKGKKGKIHRRVVRRNSMPTDQLPLSIANDGDAAFLFRLQDGRFQVVRDGAFPMLLTGPDHILVRAPLRDALRELGATGWSSVPAVLFDSWKNEEMRVYDELVIAREIRPETLDEEARAHPLGVWHSKHEALFVARTIGTALSERFPELHTSVGFELFG